MNLKLFMWLVCNAWIISSYGIHKFYIRWPLSDVLEVCLTLPVTDSVVVSSMTLAPSFSSQFQNLGLLRETAPYNGGLKSIGISVNLEHWGHLPCLPVCLSWDGARVPALWGGLRNEVNHRTHSPDRCKHLKVRTTIVTAYEQEYCYVLAGWRWAMVLLLLPLRIPGDIREHLGHSDWAVQWSETRDLAGLQRDRTQPTEACRQRR